VPLIMKESDGFLKSPSAALPACALLHADRHCILRRCSVTISTLHSSGFVRLASVASYFAIPILTFYESIKSRVGKRR